MLLIKNLSVSYGSFNVLNQLNLRLSENQIHGIVGLNGSGKTTLLNCLYGNLKSEKGFFSFNNQVLTKQQIAFLETTNYFYPFITGYEYLKLIKTVNRNFNIEKWNELFDLPLKKLIETYSTGMKKKLAFIGILCLDKSLIFLDEPFNGVDLETNQKLKHIIKKLAEIGKTVILTSHILETLTNSCDTISYLNNKNIEFTIEQKEFHTLESKIFQYHDENTKAKINDLLKNTF